MNMKTKGFTLIEILIVIAVISILIGIALPRFRGMQEEGNIAKAKGELRTLQTAAESYYVHNSNTYPVNLTALTGQIPSIVSSIPNDPFQSTNCNYAYKVNGGYYAIYSIGPKGNGSVSTVTNTGVTELNGDSCIYVSNVKLDVQP